MKELKIYQINNNADYEFRGFNFAKEYGFSMNDYKLVYEGKRKDSYELENAFEEFNCHIPLDFKGHSLSVSDIVEINGRKWYCDNFGWYEV